MDQTFPTTSKIKFTIVTVYTICWQSGLDTLNKCSLYLAVVHNFVQIFNIFVIQLFIK